MVHHYSPSESTAAIFSPSVARVAASNARDWSYIDSWLSSKFAGRTVPSFERNTETLRLLLATASANEVIDEEHSLLSCAEVAALRELQNHGHGQQHQFGGLRKCFLTALENVLPRDGKVALESLANLVADNCRTSPEPHNQGAYVVQLERALLEVHRLKTRTEILQQHLERESTRMRNFNGSLQSDRYQLSPDLPRHNLDLQRRIKTVSAQLPERCDLAAAQVSTISSNLHTVGQLSRDEDTYLDLLATKKQLELQLASFDGLHNDPDMARAELESLRDRLRGVTTRRDAVFEGLVERESPVKRR
jgi:HAUS augmin-like complex subunit 1